MLLAGADKCAINSAAVRNPNLINEAAWRFGSQCVVVAIDARRHGDRWQVYVNGGRVPADLDAVAWAQEVERRGPGEILLTSAGRLGLSLQDLSHRRSEALSSQPRRASKIVSEQTCQVAAKHPKVAHY